MKKVILTSIAAFALVTTTQAALIQTFFDDFSGDLSQWNQTHLAGSGISINGSQQLVVDADQNDPRGMVLTTYSTPSSLDLSNLVGDEEIYMRISFDVISGSTHGGELLISATPGSGSDSAVGTHTLSPLADPAGGGRGHGHGRYTGSVDAGPSNSGLNGTSTQSPVGKNVRLDWISSLLGEGQATRRVEVYYDNALEFQFDEPVDASRLEFSGGPVGFYLLLNRDFTIDNFSISEAIPEPGSIALLGCGALMLAAARRRRS